MTPVPPTANAGALTLVLPAMGPAKDLARHPFLKFQGSNADPIGFPESRHHCGSPRAGRDHIFQGGTRLPTLPAADGPPLLPMARMQTSPLAPLRSHTSFPGRRPRFRSRHPLPRRRSLPENRTPHTQQKTPRSSRGRRVFWILLRTIRSTLRPTSVERVDANPRRGRRTSARQHRLLRVTVSELAERTVHSLSERSSQSNVHRLRAKSREFLRFFPTTRPPPV